MNSAERKQWEDEMIRTMAREDLPHLGELLDRLEGSINTILTGTASPLASALAMHWNDGYRYLLERGADVNQKGPGGHTVLHQLCMREVTFNPQLIVHLAELTLAAGADVNQADDAGMVPLLYAACAGHAGLVKCLLDAGADPFLFSEENAARWSRGIALLPVVENILGEAKARIHHEQIEHQTAIVHEISRSRRF